MSQQDVQLVSRCIELLQESFRAGAAADGLLELCAADFRLDASRRVFNPAVYDGAAGLGRAIREIFDAWEDFAEINQRLIDTGDRVVVLHTISGRGRASQVPVEQDGALVWTVRDGLVRQVAAFPNHADALAATGLAEPPE